MLMKFGEFELDDSLRTLTRNGQRVRLSGQALDLLFFLVERPGQLISREEIKHHLWPDSKADLEHSLDVLINRLRTVLGDSGKSSRHIETVSKRGYRFLAQVGCEQSPSKRKPLRDPVRRILTYAAVALLAAMIALLMARTRYQKFIPPEHSPVSTNASPRAK